MCELQALIDQARQQGLRMTRQRVAILQALCKLGGHASAEDIYEQAILQRRDLDLSTVYRTLERLRDLRILSQTDLGRGSVEYEVVADEPHHHLICQCCGQVIDLDHSYLRTIAVAIRRDFAFEPILDHFAIFGRCPECTESGDGLEARGED